MEKKKFIILLMSCNKPLYLKEEQACRETFLKDAEGADIPFWFYRGGEERQFIDTDRVMHFNCPDGLGGTSKKTVLAMTVSLQLGDWDYLIKTNVSTWLNIGKIAEAIDKWDGRSDHKIYGARYLVNTSSKNVPFPRGHFSIFSRDMVEGIVKWSPKLIGEENFPKTDDTLIGLSCLYQIMRVYDEKYQDCLMEVPAVNDWTESLEDAPDVLDALCIRCKDGGDNEKTPDNMRRAHELLHTPVSDWKRKGYRPVNMFETGFGLMNYDVYSAMDKVYKAFRKDTASKDYKCDGGSVKRKDAESRKEGIKKRLEGGS